MGDQAAKQYVVIQAGGRGSRLRHHTWNKPKCLVSVNGKPILYHIFVRFPAASFIVIGDYLFDQLEKYLAINPPQVPYSLVRATGKGTSSGIAAALEQIPPEASFVLAWSDLVLGELPPWPATSKPIVCTTSAFPCRWTLAPDGRLQEKLGNTDGIPGLFYFPRRSACRVPPAEGEFVKWFADNVPDFAVLDCPDMQELGDFASIDENNDRSGFCRFFNKVEVGLERVTKTVIDPAYEDMHRREVAWYAEVEKLRFRRIPKVYSQSPLVLERIQGQHAYQMNDLSEREKRAVLADLLDSLIALHDLGSAPADAQDVQEVYIAKTISRVQSVAGMIPGFGREAMTINGKKCRNVFAPKHRAILDGLLQRLQPQHFVPIHGDPTFSNTMIDDKLRVWFIDPRGYFAKPGIMGDAWYDFAKVYYSAVGGYDAFNRRKFKLHVDEETVEVLMETPHLAATAQQIFPDYFGAEMKRIEILHALIWLSLSGYVKDDIDSVIGAFYLGLYWLETALQNA